MDEQVGCRLSTVGFCSAVHLMQGTYIYLDRAAKNGKGKKRKEREPKPKAGHHPPT